MKEGASKMKYVKAETVLPKALLEEIQHYVQGQNLYIPKPKQNHHQWGERSGERDRVRERNNQIKQSFGEGKSVQELADEYFLSVETVKKIVIGDLFVYGDFN